MQSLHLQQRLTEFINAVSEPLIVILGPTASGKTSFSIDLATQIPGAEIINADSRQLYKFLDIGTAKITKEKMLGIPHHLLDVLDPKEEATAAWYKREATRVIKEIHGRKHVPILVGGSMLYISTVIDDLQFPIERDLRKSLQMRKEMRLRDHLFIIGIERSREELMHCINQRTTELFRQGWIEEIRYLLKNGYTPADPAMKSHGYREIMEWLCHGEFANHDAHACRPSQAQDDTLQSLQKSISSKTRQYARRQITWWKNDQRIQWTTPDEMIRKI